MTMGSLAAAAVSLFVGKSSIGSSGARDPIATRETEKGGSLDTMVRLVGNEVSICYNLDLAGSACPFIGEKKGASWG